MSLTDDSSPLSPPRCPILEVPLASLCSWALLHPVPDGPGCQPCPCQSLPLLPVLYPRQQGPRLVWASVRVDAAPQGPVLVLPKCGFVCESEARPEADSGCMFGGRTLQLLGLCTAPGGF